MDCAVIGGGIVGLSVGMTLLQRQPGLKLIVLEKEPQLALHQWGGTAASFTREFITIPAV